MKKASLLIVAIWPFFLFGQFPTVDSSHSFLMDEYRAEIRVAAGGMSGIYTGTPGGTGFALLNLRMPNADLVTRISIDGKKKKILVRRTSLLVVEVKVKKTSNISIELYGGGGDSLIMSDYFLPIPGGSNEIFLRHQVDVPRKKEMMEKEMGAGRKVRILGMENNIAILKPTYGGKVLPVYCRFPKAEFMDVWVPDDAQEISCLVEGVPYSTVIREFGNYASLIVPTFFDLLTYQPKAHLDNPIGEDLWIKLSLLLESMTWEKGDVGNLKSRIRKENTFYIFQTGLDALDSEYTTLYLKKVDAETSTIEAAVIVYSKDKGTSWGVSTPEDKDRFEDLFKEILEP